MNPESLYIITVSGHTIYLDNPADFLIEDIATGLSNICRWGGQIKRFWSVAQHSLALYRVMPPAPELKRAALLHDAAEAYIGDITRPVLRHVEGRMAELKKRMESSIEAQYGFRGDEPVLRRWDDQIIHVEAAVFGLKIHPVCQEPFNLTKEELDIAGEAIVYYSERHPGDIRREFLSLYSRLLPR